MSRFVEAAWFESEGGNLSHLVILEDKDYREDEVPSEMTVCDVSISYTWAMRRNYAQGKCVHCVREIKPLKSKLVKEGKTLLIL